MMRILLILFIQSFAFSFFSCIANKDNPMYSDDFESDLKQWTIEQMPEGESKIVNGKLEIDDKDGCTIWFNEKMSGNIRIEYDVRLINNGGANDRVSDLNCFWKAIDPLNPENILTETKTRTGKFANYHGFRLYYVGYGANNNTSTRFRRYPGDGTRPLLPEHDLTDSVYMNSANEDRHVVILCVGNKTIYKIDGKIVFDFTDEDVYIDGWFGFRTVKNHMQIDNFKVFKL